jgi:hypothetical protein
MRSVIAVLFASCLLAGPVLALGTEPVHERHAALRRAPLPDAIGRVDRWRGTPYVRGERELALREALDKTLVRQSDLTTIPAFAEEDAVLRRHALDKLLPIGGPLFSTGVGGF